MSRTCESGERETIAVASGFAGNARGHTLGERYDLVGLLLRGTKTVNP